MASVADVVEVQQLSQAGIEIPGRATLSGTSPDPCDLCTHMGVGRAMVQPAVVDGKTVHGLWARMCMGHFRDAGIGLGPGRGQVLLTIAQT